MRYAVLVWKCGLLLKQMDDEADCAGARVFHCLLDDVPSMYLVRECRELEVHISTSVTDSIVHQSEISIRASVKIRLKNIDKEIMLSRCTEKAPFVADIERMLAGLNCGMQHST